MCTHDKLRILWIDDCEGGHSQYQYPEAKLPQEYERDFVIVRPGTASAPSTLCNVHEFSALFADFWSGQAKDIFPVEIIAMDYVLSKWAPGTLQPRRAPDAEAEIVRQVMQDNSSQTASNPSIGVEYRAASFEGLLIGIYYASLTCDHPAGVVPMTNYGDLMEGVDEVRALHEMTRPVLSIDYSKFGVSGQDRSWRNVLAQGVRSHSARLVQLAKASIVSLSFDDLLAMGTDGGHAVITVRSRFSRRCFPTAGLFVDVPAERRNAAASEWAKQLLGDATEGEGGEPKYQQMLDDWIQGRELADKLWKAYNDQAMMGKRQLLSWTVHELKAKRRNIDSLSDEERSAIETFALQLEKELAGARGSECGAEFVDIRHPDYSARQKRWAALMIIVRLVHRRWTAAKSWATYAQNQDWRGAAEGLLYEVDKDDVFLALYPLAKGPIVLPWHDGKQPDSSWQTLKRLSSVGAEAKQANDPSKGSEFGNLALSVPDVLNGLDWTDDATVPTGKGDHGFRFGERIIMQWYAESLYGDDDWKLDRQMTRVLQPQGAKGGAT